MPAVRRSSIGLASTPKTSLGLRGCGAGGDVISLVRHVRGFNFKEAVATSPAKIRHPQPVRPEANGAAGDRQWRQPGKSARALARRRRSARNRGRAISTAAHSKLDDDLAGDVIRWHPRIGAMVALFRNILTGEPQAVCRTFLDAKARKIGRKFLGPVAGAAIMLDAFDEVLEGLHIGEGVETCMAARQLGLRPCWALGSRRAVAAFPFFGGIECLTLLQENDDASERACEACAARWHAAGREVFINQPTAGKDLNDAIRGSP